MTLSRSTTTKIRERDFGEILASPSPSPASECVSASESPLSFPSSACHSTSKHQHFAIKISSWAALCWKASFHWVMLPARWWLWFLPWKQQYWWGSTCLCFKQACASMLHGAVIFEPAYLNHKHDQELEVSDSLRA